MKRTGYIFGNKLLVALSIGALFCIALSTFASHLVVREEIAQVDAVIVLLGGKRPERLKKAAEVYHQGFASRIIFGSGYIQSSLYPFFTTKQSGWIPAGARYLRELRMLNVDPRNITMVPTPLAKDTESELFAISNFVRKRGFKKVALVTSASHSRRTKMIWSRLSPDIESIVVGARNPERKMWWRSSHGVFTVLYEALGFMKEYARRMGLFPRHTYDSVPQ